MADPLLSPRLALPLLAAAQAQKEITHNEAVLLLEAVALPLVEAVGLSSPPSAPSPGQAWIVGAAPTGAWARQSGALALWTDGGWRFAMLPTGAEVRVIASSARWVRRSDGWHAPQSILPATGGAVIDAEARAALAALIAALVAIGILA